MSTAYYRKYRITEDDKSLMHHLIDDGNILSKKTGFSVDDLKIEESLEDVLNKFSNSIHICSTSCGNPVHFDHNWGEYYQPNRKSLEDFLSEPNTYIEDEYGRELSNEEFWKMVDGHNKNAIADSVTKRYIYICKEQIEKCKKMFGVDTDSIYFTVDGLTFAVFSDFA